jgi:hypothetical protein
MKPKYSVALAVVYFALAGGSQAATQENTEDFMGIHNIEIMFHEAGTTKNLDLMLSLFADDAMLTSNGKTYKGKEEIRSHWQAPAHLRGPHGLGKFGRVLTRRHTRAVGELRPDPQAMGRGDRKTPAHLQGPHWPGQFSRVLTGGHSRHLGWQGRSDYDLGPCYRCVAGQFCFRG